MSSDDPRRSANRRMLRPLPPKPCALCGQSFVPYRPSQRFCSADCRNIVYTPRRMEQRLKALYAELVSRGLAPESIRRLVNS
jgi:predicted nucleic acid-binding Zn ribbon protein